MVPGSSTRTERQLGISDLGRIALAVTNAEEENRAHHATEDERRNQSLADDNERDERASPCRDTRTTGREARAVGERHGISLSEVSVPSDAPMCCQVVVAGVSGRPVMGHSR